MKKSIQTIFDEANASEIENLISENVVSNISADKLSFIKSKVYARTGIKNAKRNGFFFRWQWIAAVAACVCVIVSVLFATGVFNASPAFPPDGGTETSILYQSDNVVVSLLEDCETTTYFHYEWATLSDEVVYTKNTVILTGVASNIRQATVSYEFMGQNAVDNITIFDIEVDEVLACRSGSYKQGDTVTVGVGYNMNTYGEGLPVIEEGKTYLIFCYVAADRENDVMELAQYVDCWISAPKDLFLEKVGSCYLSVDYFSNVSSAITIAKQLNLTQKQVFSLSNLDANNTDAIKSFVNEEITTNLSAELEKFGEGLIVLKNRTMSHSGDLWSLTNRTYLIDGDELEGYIRNMALMYGN